MDPPGSVGFHVAQGEGMWDRGCSLWQVHEGPSIGWAGGLRAGNGEAGGKARGGGALEKISAFHGD